MELVEEIGYQPERPRSPLSPSDSWSRAEIDEWMFWESNNRDPMRVERGDRALDIMERHLRDQWFVGESAPRPHRFRRVVPPLTHSSLIRNSQTEGIGPRGLKCHRRCSPKPAR